MQVPGCPFATMFAALEAKAAETGWTVALVILPADTVEGDDLFIRHVDMSGRGDLGQSLSVTRDQLDSLNGRSPLPRHDVTGIENILAAIGEPQS